ncbi:hypothetical protein N9385_00070 [Candidatus Nitrosopelagicus sp.]|nr:hypothetical protein [Candidatus Nitrosopelagicus sp.]
MNKELGRKITSLTLMTIMLTWSAAMGFSSTFMPEAEAANEHLYVSAEAEGSFTKAQVIEVVVSEGSIADLDTAYGMPDVSINGSSILMAQAVDGAWYAYVADADSANALDAYYTQESAGGSSGGDFGKLCGPATDLTYKNDDEAVSGLAASETQGVFIPNDHGSVTDAEGTSAYSQGDVTTACTITAANHTINISAGQNSTSNQIMNVVREPPALSNGTSINEYGNIKLGANLWPMIQLLDFSGDGNVDIVYNRAGADETVSLVYTDGAEGLSFDKDIYGLKHEVGMTLNAWNANIDPTDEDVWTFGTLPTNQTAYYQLYDENGAADASTQGTSGAGGNAFAFTTATIGDILPAGTLSIDRNGDTVTSDATTDAVVNFQDNADTICTAASGLCPTADINAADQPITLTEAGANTGVFVNWDEGLTANMLINTDAKRGSQAVFEFDEVKYGVLHMPQFATIEYLTDDIGAEWNSGEVVSIEIFDPDMNFDNRSEDVMTVASTSSIVPAIKIGSPITLKTLTTLQSTGNEAIVTWDSDLENQCSSDYASSTATSYTSCYEKYSERSIITVAAEPAAFAASDKLIFTHSSDTTVSTLTDLISNANGTAAYTYVQYDFRGLNGGSDNLSFKMNFTIGDSSFAGGAIGDVGLYGTTSGTIGTAANSHVGIAYTEGLVGNALLNHPLYKLAGTSSLTGGDALRVIATFLAVDSTVNKAVGDATPLSLDIVTWGQSEDGVNSSDRHNNAIYRLEVEEDSPNGSGNDSGLFDANVEYVMLNQLNVNNTNTYNSTVAYGDQVVMIVHNDSTDEDEIRVSYLDLGADGVETQISDQLAAPTHSGVVEFDNDSYKEADTVTVTLTDSDLNTEPELINIYTVVNDLGDPAHDQVGKDGYGQNSVGANNGRMLDITIDDELWLDSDSTTDGNAACSSNLDSGVTDGLYNSGFTLVETGVDTGVFTGDFQIPSQYGARSSGTCTVTSTLGKDLEVNYVDYRDASGEIIEVGDGAGIRANTGSVSLDRTVYPVPFGQISDFTAETSKKNPNGRSVFPIHATGISGSYLDAASETLGNGDLTIHIRVDDPDYDVSATGEDQIAENTTSSSNRGPLKIYVSRGSEAVVLATAGADNTKNGVITATTTVVDGGVSNGTRELGPISETAPDSGVFELDMTVKYTDGPDSADCPSKTSSYTATDGSTGTGSGNRFASTASSQYHCILQGDVITVEYTDQNDASGNTGVAFDSATFDMRNGVLQTDKSVYIIGSDIIMTLIEPDLNLESDESETWDLDLIEWDSDAKTTAMGNSGDAGTSYASTFDPEPSDFRETGDSTGIFQIVIEVPSTLAGTALDRGEQIDLEYVDYSPSGAKYVGEESSDIGVTVYTSNFGATIELDQKVYTWTDKVYITIVAPDHNFDSGLVDKIGDTDDDPLIVQTRTQKLTGYTLAETGSDTGIFSGEVILKGYNYDADGDPDTGDSSGYDVTSISSASGTGPTDGAIKSTDDDGLTVSYEFNEDEVIVGSALVRWNIGEAQWLESSYPAGSSGVIRVVDPDMNWDPENVDNFNVDVWSSSDQGGVSVTITETNEATGTFEGTVTFTVDDESSGHRLRVAEGDTITVEYDDNTLPGPDYTSGDSLSITGTSIIGTVVPPLERAPAANARVVDSFGNSLSEVSVDQQVQIEADLVNGQDKDQSFAYLVQVQDGNGVTVSLAWITGQLAAGQSFSPALSWIPSSAGTYEATVFVWESVDNPTALSDTVSTSIRVV